MFLQWPSSARLDNYRFIVVGAGPAGLYLALSLAGQGKVLVLEAGNTAEPLNQGDDYYQILSDGRDYPLTGTRLSAFGGTSNHWGGNSLPLPPEIFSGRANFPDWPVDHADYAAFIPDAARFLNLRPFDDAGKSSIESGILSDHDHLTVAKFQFSTPTVRFGDAAYIKLFAANPNIDVLCDVRLVDLGLTPGTDAVESVTLLHRPSRATMNVGVKQLVLCAGGIENARILMWAGRKYAAGNPLLGGPAELTGKRFVEKPYFGPVTLFLDSRVDLTDAVPTETTNNHHAWELSHDFRTAHGLPRFGVFPEFGRAPTDDEEAVLTTLAQVYGGRASSYIRLDPPFQFEQTPHDGSHMALDGSVDSDGIARARVHWEILQSDIDAYRKATLMFCGVLNQKGYARAVLRPDFQREDWSGLQLGLCGHHDTTTPMGASPATGVVDGDCRVFGLANLFIAGSSTFPATDYINPTLNLVAMAGRLAKHLAETAT